jgi:hypothetical protein
VVLGATFHKTAVLLLPIAAMANTKNRWWTIFWVGGVTVAAYFMLLADAMDDLYEGYVEAEYQSEGALLRLSMNALPALGLLAFAKRLHLPKAQTSLWRWFAIISLGLFALLFFTSASTALDRIALYMLPLQIVVFSRLPELLAPTTRRLDILIVMAVLVYYSIVLAVWLMFATHATFWVPYRFYPLEMLV